MTVSLSATNQASQWQGGNPKAFTDGFKPFEIKITDDGTHLGILAKKANRLSISGSIFKDGHRSGSNVIKGSQIILIDCDEPGQSEAVESKLKYYDGIKIPSASNLEKDYKWHFIIPTQSILSVYPSAFKWQIEQFFRQIGITDDMIDVTGSYDIARQFAPGILGMTAEQADELTEGNTTGLQAPVAEPPQELCSTAAKSVTIKIRSGRTVSDLPLGHLWFDGQAVSFNDIIEAVEEETVAGRKEDPEAKINVSKFGCPHDNDQHTLDRTKDYGFGFVHPKSGNIVIKCTGNACSKNPYFVVPTIQQPPIKENIEMMEPVLEPIHPNEFATMVRNRIVTLSPDFKFSDAMMEGFRYYGSTYNAVLQKNLNGESPTRFALPAPTGGGKSVSAKLYLAHIAKLGFSGLLVVGRNTEARKAVEEINAISGTKVAVCTYTDSDDFGYKVSIEELRNYPVIVISHQLFLQRSYSLKNIEMIRDFKKQNRNIVIIDEKINFKRTTEIDIKELQKLIDDLSFLSSGYKNIWGNIKKKIDEIICRIKDTKQQIDGIDPDPDLTYSLIKKNSGLISLLRKGKGNIKDEFNGRDSYIKDKKRAKIIEQLERFAFICQNVSMVIRNGDYLKIAVNEDLTNRFGSVAILDATLRSSLIYKAHKHNRDDIKEIGLPEGIRDYSNSTLHIWNNSDAKQSRIHFKAREEEGKLETVIDNYLSYMYSLVADGEPLLVCTFKDYVELFRTRCESDLIIFLHWGIHSATNEYNQYAKAMLIGWPAKPSKEFYYDIDSILADSKEYEPFSGSMEEDAVLMAAGEMASDIVQFLNRTRSRTVNDEQGRSRKTSFYMIMNEHRADNPIDFIMDEMPGLKIGTWNESKTYPIFKKTKQVDLADRVIAYLLQKQGYVISKKDLITHFYGSETKEAKKAVEHLMGTDYFKSLLGQNEIDVESKRGRSGGTYFSIPQFFEDPNELEIAASKKLRELMGMK